MSVITAVFRNGMLQPKVPLGFAEGEEVQLAVLTSASERPLGGPSAAAKAAVLAIAELPMEPGGLAFNGLDHDRILYGGEGGAR
jgi:predicted DNA-binding antitoxin AbrB/MazE fold protein